MHLSFSRNYVLFAILAFTGGCIIVPGTNGSSSSSSSSSASGSSSSSGSGGSGGSGGGGIGVGGGSSGCVEGKGEKGLLACDSLNTVGVLCGPAGMEAPAMANDVCTRGFAIYQGASFDVLHTCLQTIEKADACVTTPVETCVGEMYKATCPSTAAATTCDGLATVTCKGEAFDAGGCMFDTNPFNQAALDVLADCMAKSDPNLISCQDAYTECFNTITTFCEPNTPGCVPLRAPRPNTF